ncbi:O-antigen ligase family protein [Rhodopseudomonas telluris]|uniref:O-antigen ligase family protein n=1 Tax=Rhodopseudomonas telluris TaxID=644215 RepID=A0ABV6EW75_9BRAD
MPISGFTHSPAGSTRRGSHRSRSSRFADRAAPIVAALRTTRRLFQSVFAGNGIPGAILLLVVATAPFPFGSADDIQVAFWCICLSLCLLMVTLREASAAQLWLLSGIGMIVIGYVFVLHEQLSDTPWLAPYHPIWKQASAVLGTQLPPSASIVRHAAFFALGAPLANILSLSIGLAVGGNRRFAWLLVKVLAWSGACYALYGLLQQLIEPQMILWREKVAYVGSVTSTFVNRNTAACYFGSCTVLWMLLILVKIRRRLPGRRLVWRHLRADLRLIPPREIAIDLAAFAVCLVAMFMTGSRAGVALSLLTMVVAFSIFIRRDLPARSGIWLSLGTGTLIAIGVLQFLGGRVNSRFETRDLVDAGRLEAWKSTLRIIGDNPWFGTGMGTFTSSFPAYRSPNISIQGFWNAAHSTPLELASEIGLPLALLVATGWLVMLIVYARGVLYRSRDAVLPLAAAAIASLALLHSSVDFSLQIPGYSIPFFALFGVGLAQSFSSSLRADPTSGNQDAENAASIGAD